MALQSVCVCARVHTNTHGHVWWGEQAFIPRERIQVITFVKGEKTMGNVGEVNRLWVNDAGCSFCHSNLDIKTESENLNT